MKKLLFTLLFICAAYHSWAQNVVTGIVTDSQAASLVGVNISVSTDITLGTSTDFNGNFKLSLPDGCHDIVFQYIGFEEHSEHVCLGKKTQTVGLNILLKEASELLGTIVVSAGKFEQKIEEVTVSMDVIKTELIENKTANSLDKTINQAPAVHVVDGQANIRSGSGWSYGAGSRVMVMVDGIPLMSGDQGAVQWQLIPMENISQIEVIKGASSVLFGSSALNGTINIRTAYPSTEPTNKLSITHTVYGKPQRESIHWYKGGYTSANNISFLHTHKKDNRDFVLGTNLFYDGGFQYKVLSKRARINLAHTTYSKQVEGLSYGIRANIMRSKIGDAIMWEHDSLAYTPLDSDPGFKNNLYLSVDPFIVFNDVERGIKHSFNSRYLHMNIYPGYQDSLQYSSKEALRFSNVYYGDYQLQKQFYNFLTLTSGYTFKFSDGQDMEVYGKNKNTNHSVYSQADIKHKRINLSFGGRFEYYNDEDTTLYKPIFRSGINYQVAEATFLRASYGEGIRFPTMLERFITYNTGPMYIYANPSLKPETGWSSEIGIKQAIQFGDWKGYIDLAAFVMKYDDMMEFSFGKWADTSEGVLPGFGFKSINIGKSIIKGAEFSFAGEGKIGQTEIMLMGSYTFTSPLIDDLYNEYDTYASISGGDTVSIPISYYTTSIDTSGILKYRYEHLAKFDLNLQHNRISGGFSLRYNSAMKNIDKVFNDFLFEATLGTKSAWEKYNTPNWLIDFRLGYDLTENSRLAFNIDNLFNKEYLLRPASLGAPRTYSVLYKISF